MTLGVEEPWLTDRGRRELKTCCAGTAADCRGYEVDSQAGRMMRLRRFIDVKVTTCKRLKVNNVCNTDEGNGR